MSRGTSSRTSGSSRAKPVGRFTVTGTGLNDLVGKRFRVGTVGCYGVELCEPCLHLEEVTRPGIIKDLVHRAGLNADILSDGPISVGDEIVELDGARAPASGVRKQRVRVLKAG